MLQTWIPIYELLNPPTLLFFKYFIIKPMYSNFLVLLLFLDNIILHTSTNNVTYFWMRNHHKKKPLYQLLLIFYLYPPPQVMNLLLVLVIILNNTLQVIIYIIRKHYILHHIQIRDPIFNRLLLLHVCQYLINKTQLIKNRQIHTLFKHAIYLIYRIPTNSQQFTLFFSKNDIVLFTSCPISSSEHTYDSEEEIIYLL